MMSKKVDVQSLSFSLVLGYIQRKETCNLKINRPLIVRSKWRQRATLYILKQIQASPRDYCVSVCCLRLQETSAWVLHWYTSMPFNSRHIFGLNLNVLHCTDCAILF